MRTILCLFTKSLHPGGFHNSFVISRVVFLLHLVEKPDWNPTDGRQQRNLPNEIERERAHIDISREKQARAQVSHERKDS